MGSTRVTLAWLGPLLREGSRFEEAEAVLTEARGIVISRLAPADPDRMRVQDELALLTRSRG